MTFEPEPMQVLLLWKLATCPEGMWLKEFPGHMVEKGKRDPLVRAGWIEEEKRRLEVPGKRATSLRHLILTESGWQWLSTHLNAPVSRSNYAADILHALLGKLSLHLQRQQLALADFMLASGETEPDAPTDGPAACGDTGSQAIPEAQSEAADAGDSDSLEQRIAEAYRQLSGDRSQRRVRLADLRRILAQVPRNQLDEQLRAMERSGKLVLNPLDDPRQIAAEDEEAKLLTPLGDPRHLVHMEIPAHVA